MPGMSKIDNPFWRRLQKRKNKQTSDGTQSVCVGPDYTLAVQQEGAQNLSQMRDFWSAAEEHLSWILKANTSQGITR